MLTAFDFEPVMFANVPQSVYDYTAHGDGGEWNLRRNRQAFDWVDLIPGKAVDPSTVDLSSQLLDLKLKYPIVIAPTATQVALHPDGEAGMYRAARCRRTRRCASATTRASRSSRWRRARRDSCGGSSIRGRTWARARNCSSARKAPATRPWSSPSISRRRTTSAASTIAISAAAALAAAAVDAGAQRVRRVRVAPAARTIPKRSERRRSAAAPQCRARLVRGAPASARRGAAAIASARGRLWYSWEYLDQVRKFIKVPIIIKGIVTAEDARLCVERGFNGIVVSNHGGRSMDYGPSTLEALPEIVAAVNGKIPVMIDSGFRRGSDVLKALALGADAVWLGRAARWALGAFGPVGVQRLLTDIIFKELVDAAAATGKTTLASIDSSIVKQNWP